jgi:hypothetical protein
MSTFVQYDGADGVGGLFQVPFPYLLQQHVKVKVNGFPFTQGAHYSFETPTSIRFWPWAVPAPNTVVEIRRESSPDTKLANFYNGAVLTADDLNVATRQNFYLIQEIIDKYEALLNSASSRLSNGQFTDAQSLIDAAVGSVLDSALLSELQSRISDIDNNAESVLDQDARLVNLQALVDSLTDPDGGSISLLIQNETNSRITGDQGLIDTLALLGAKNGANTAFIADINKLMVGPTESFAQRFTALSTTDAANAAAITAEQTTRSNAVSAEASARTALAARVTTAEGSITSNSSAITIESTARANGDSANASSISTLTTTINGNYAALQTIANIVNGPGGITSQYMVKTDVNGHVAGFGLYNNGSFSDFQILANRFAVVDPANAGNVKVPFVVSGGVVYMQNVVIADALIENLTVGKLTSGVLTAQITQNADINVGTGRIIFDNGTYMKVTGVGFGSANQFIEWFGPKMTIGLCSEANAIQYLKTNGSAYFGGSLSAGTLFNARTTTDNAANAQIVVGPFGTNGHVKTYTLSYTFSASRTFAEAGTNSGSGSISATIDLYRTIGVGAEALIATLPATGGWFWDKSGGTRSETESISASTTYTDNVAGTSDRTLRAIISSRSLVFTATGQLQRITLTSTES